MRFRGSGLPVPLNGCRRHSPISRLIGARTTVSRDRDRFTLWEGRTPSRSESLTLNQLIPSISTEDLNFIASTSPKIASRLSPAASCARTVATHSR